MKYNNPIAVLSSTFLDGVHFLNRNNDLKIANRINSRVTDISGQEYRIITEGKDVHGYEFHSVIETDEFLMNPDREYLREAVQLRIK